MLKFMVRYRATGDLQEVNVRELKTLRHWDMVDVLFHFIDNSVLLLEARAS